jgi:uncharacterized membrane protein
MLNLFRKKAIDFLSANEKQLVVSAIQAAEKQTSGEIRVFVESRCRFVNPLDRAAEVFHQLKMEQTESRNAVLLYVATRDRQLALYGDQGIHEKVGNQFWNEKVKFILSHFSTQKYGEGLAWIISEVGEALRLHFPYNKDTDKNELPDDIVFGR